MYSNSLLLEEKPRGNDLAQKGKEPEENFAQRGKARKGFFNKSDKINFNYYLGSFEGKKILAVPACLARKLFFAVDIAAFFLGETAKGAKGISRKGFGGMISRKGEKFAKEFSWMPLSKNPNRKFQYHADWSL